MNKPIFLTVALAAALTSFAASAVEAPAIARTPLFSMQKAEKAADKKAVKAKAPAIARTPLFPTQKTGKAADKKAAKATEKHVAKATNKKAAKAAGKSAAKATRGKVSETSAKARHSVGYPAKLNLASLQAKAGAPYHATIARYAAEYGVPVSLAHAVVEVESNYRPDTRGSAGEVGLMQIKPATARGLGYSGSVTGLYDPDTNIRFGMKYLGMAHQLSGGATCGTILRYNAGHGATRMNPVSKAYCGKVQRILGS